MKAGNAFEQLLNAHKEAVTDINQYNENKGVSAKGQLEVQLTKEEEKGIGDVG